MTITAALVKELRERTGAGMMECKKALLASNGDIEAAIEEMRKSGQAKAAKKSGRVAAEGVIAVKIAADNKSAMLLEVNTETDFVARDESFTEFVDKISGCGLDSAAKTVEELLSLSLPQGAAENIAAERENLVAKLGENIQLRRLVLLQTSALVAGYCHGGKIGVLVEIDGGDAALGKDIAMHIAASKPEVIAPSDLPAELIAKEREIYLAQAAQSGKPQDIIEKMVEGRIKKYTGEVSLLGQPFVKDPAMTVGDLLQKANAKVLSFVRYEVGEGIEKETIDFAAEVRAQVEG